MEPLSPIQQMSTELEFEELLVANPDMLEPGLKLVGRQTPTQTGWLDLLAVDGDGRLVVYELKRGTLAREAVTQVLDYASALDAMTSGELAEHIARRSGSGGIDRIDDFEQWYADNYRGEDLSRLLPPRMVLVGLGVDPVAERMSRFVSAGPVDISVVTFHGFGLAEARLLARQVEVEAGSESSSSRRAPTKAERLQALRKYLTSDGYAQLFDQVHADIRETLPEVGLSEQVLKYGISFRLSKPDDPTVWRTYFGVQAGYLATGLYSVSILPQAVDWGGDEALQQLGQSVKLVPWQHGGHALSFETAAEWDDIRPAVREFVAAVLANRSAAPVS